MTFKPRFVVTEIIGGVACVRKDSAGENVMTLPFGHRIADGWRVEGVPKNVRDGSDAPGEGLSGIAGTTVFRICEIAPDEDVIAKLPQLRDQFGAHFHGASLEDVDFGMHATPTIDFITVIEGQIEMHLDGGEIVKLSAGDSVVQRGTAHAWRNTSGKPAKFSSVLVSVADSDLKS